MHQGRVGTKREKVFIVWTLVVRARLHQVGHTIGIRTTNQPPSTVPPKSRMLRKEARGKRFSHVHRKNSQESGPDGLIGLNGAVASIR